jgi:hypothetical protein
MNVLALDVRKQGEIYTRTRSHRLTVHVPTYLLGAVIHLAVVISCKPSKATLPEDTTTT